MVTLVIKGQLPTLNNYTAACRSNRYVGARMKKDCERIITAHIRKQIPDIHFDGAVRLDFKWYEPNKKRDLDNICFAKKFILDALVSNGTIRTDNWQGVLGFTDTFYVDADNPRIEVKIEGVTDYIWKKSRKTKR